ncbi:MAG: agmatinase [Candidatus Margulisiibacteriota bacterium]
MPKNKFIILPIPYEATTCYGKGAKNGPAAILSALPQVEEFDLETKTNLPLDQIEILPPLKVKNLTRLPVAKIKTAVRQILQKKKLPIILGGEHSISVPAVEAVSEFFPDLSILCFDAHADLRDKYQGRKDSHACATRRLLEICPNVVQVGVRSMSQEEYGFAKASGQSKKIHLTDNLIRQSAISLAAINPILRQLSNTVYISFDVDVLDPAEMPSTGTPEPGGLHYNQVVDIIRAVTRQKNVVGFDVVELAPIKGLLAPNYLAARLVYKILALL